MWYISTIFMEHNENNYIWNKWFHSNLLPLIPHSIFFFFNASEETSLFTFLNSLRDSLSHLQKSGMFQMESGLQPALLSFLPLFFQKERIFSESSEILSKGRNILNLGRKIRNKTQMNINVYVGWKTNSKLYVWTLMSKIIKH